MGELRKPLFFAAMALIILVVLLEVGSSFLTRLGKFSGGALGNLESMKSDLKDAGLSDKEIQDTLSRIGSASRPPGVAIGLMALIDGMIAYTVGLMGLSLLVPGRVHGKYQGAASLMVSLVVAIASFTAIFLTVALLMLMIALILAFPFGTIIYMVKWGTFNRGAASATMSLIMALKIGFIVCLVLAQQRFLQNKGLVRIILTSLAANVLISFLHGLVPIVLVSITDAIAAIVVAVLAGLWALYLLAGAIPAVRRSFA
jgi:hypothetical protein